MFLWALLSGAAALVLVSLLTRPEPEEKDRDFFARMRISADHTAALVEKSRVAGKSHEDEGPDDRTIEDLSRKTSESGDQLLFLNIAQLWRGTHGIPFLKAYRRDLSGLVYSWGVVILIVAIAWAIMQLG